MAFHPYNATLSGTVTWSLSSQAYLDILALQKWHLCQDLFFGFQPFIGLLQAGAGIKQSLILLSKGFYPVVRGLAVKLLMN